MPVRLRTNGTLSYFNFSMLEAILFWFRGKLEHKLFSLFLVFSAFIKPLTNNILWIEMVVSIYMLCASSVVFFFRKKNKKTIAIRFWENWDTKYI